MKILRTDIFRFSIPMHPFTIATGTMHYAQNLFIRVHTDAGYYGVGECSAFPMIVGETQATCFEMAKEFAAMWIGKEAFDIEQRMQELHAFTAFNGTVKSAFDMALYDLSARAMEQPLYKFLGGKNRPIQTDLTIGIDSPENMARKAIQFQADGVRIIKVKLGKAPEEDIERIRQIRKAVGPDILIRVDANQGWSFDQALRALKDLAPFDIQFCEQPLRHWYDERLPELRKKVPVKIMADESVFDHHDALRLIQAGACDYINIKFAKSGGILEATKIARVCADNGVPCMMGGMLESRIALTAFAHFALAHENILFHDMDTCLLGHKVDPAIGGVRYNGYFLETPETPGLGANADQAFLDDCVSISV